MQNKVKKSIKYLCPSCEHIMSELKQDFSDFLCMSSLGQEFIEKSLKCAKCGQKLQILDQKSEINLFLSAIINPKIKVVAYTAPSIRTSLGEAFNMPLGTDVTGKMVNALKMIGVDYVFDMNFAADLTTVEEACEFKARLESGKNLPMLTSCCPAWVAYVERAYPSLISKLSTCKSPQQMFGAILNSYFAKKLNIINSNLFVVSIVPCVAKKLERLKVGHTKQGYDVDCTLTTIDLADIIKLKGIDLNSLEDAEFDNEFGLSSGAGVIFGNSGGVMEAVMESSSAKHKEFEIKKATFNLVRGRKGIREATIFANGKEIKIACVSGLANAKPLLDECVKNNSPYSFIEVMACDGGCVGGGGQPLSNNREQAVKMRAQGLYNRALKCNYKNSFENPAIISLYENFLGEFGGSLAYDILHVKRK